jgi:hypothetical protein
MLGEVPKTTLVFGRNIKIPCYRGGRGREINSKRSIKQSATWEL